MSLQFNDTTNKQGLIQSLEDSVMGGNYGSISDNASLLARFTRYINNALDQITVLILDSDNRWQYDDSNHTDQPIGKTNLSNGVATYSFDPTHIKVLGADVLVNGKYQPLEPIDTRDIRQTGQSETEFLSTNGIPQYYDVFGGTINLYPAPDTTQVDATNGLRLRFQRNPSYFSATDTTKAPGIPSIFHPLVAKMAKHEYLSDNSEFQKANDVLREVEIGKQQLQAFFSKRNVDEVQKITIKRVSYK